MRRSWAGPLGRAGTMCDRRPVRNRRGESAAVSWSARSRNDHSGGHPATAAPSEPVRAVTRATDVTSDSRS
jgi:hypothetical protein